MADQDAIKRLLLGLAADAAKVGAKAGLAALDSAFSDAQRVASRFEKRVKRARDKIANTAARMAPEEDEEE